MDFIVETEGALVPVEAKVSATPRPGMAGGIRAFSRDFAKKVGPGYVVHSGDVTLPLGDGVTAIPFGLL